MCAPIVTFFFSFVLHSVISFSKAGIYIDNGLDQTTIDRDLSKAEKMELEFEILNILGLPNKPKKVHKSLKKSTLKYLMSVYNTLMEKEQQHHRNKRSAHYSLSEEKQHAIEESDVIMTFDSISHYGDGFRHEKGKRLWFNVSEMPVAEDIVGAELRIYQKRTHVPKRNKHVFTVTVYELGNLRRHEEFRYISSVNTTGNFYGWLDLNLTACLPSWVAFPDSNKGLYLTVHPAGNPGREMLPEVLGLTTTKEDGETQPFMVAFLKNTNQVYPKRPKRDVKKKHVKKTQISKYPAVMKSYQHDTWRTICKINTLHISFRDLGWQNWIVAPDGYSAYYCAGECKFPLTAHMNATGHALVQSWVHYMYPHKFPKPCCAPTEMMPMYLIYQQMENAVLRKRKDMVVKSCGCH